MLQIGPVVAQTQRRWEREHPQQARRTPVLVTPGRAAPSPAIARAVKRKAAAVQQRQDQRTQQRIARQAERAYADLGRSVATQAALQGAVARGQREGSKRKVPVKGFFGAVTYGHEAQIKPSRYAERGAFSALGKTPKELATLAAVLNDPDPKRRDANIEAIRQANFAKAQQASVSAPARKLLDVATRPVNLTAGFTSAALKGKDPLKGAWKGLTSSDPKDRKLFSDVLKEHGVRGPAASVLGFALDIGLDPTTYITLGTTSVAREAALSSARTAARQAEASALRAGATRAIARERGRSAARSQLKRQTAEAELKAAPRHHAPGVDVRLAGRRLPGVTRATGAVRHGATRAAERLPESVQTARRATRSVGSELHAGVRPVGQTQAERAQVKGLQRESRAESERVVRHVNQRVNALLGWLKDDERRLVIDAIESGDMRSLRGAARPLRSARKGGRDPDRLYIVARRLQDDLKYLRRVGRRSGLLAGDIGAAARTRLEGVHAAPRAGIRSEAKVLRALEQARGELRSAQAAVRAAASPAERMAARRRAAEISQRVGNLRRRRAGIRAQDVRAAGRERVAGASRASRGSEARGYFPRPRAEQLKRRGVLEELAEPSDVPVVRETVGANRPEIGAAERRQYRQPRAALRTGSREQRAAVEPLSEDAPAIVAHYGASVAKGAAARNLNTRLLQTFGRKLPRNISKAQVLELANRGHGVYRVRRGVLERLDPERSFGVINAASRERGLATGGQYAILDDAVVKRVRDQAQDVLAAHPKTSRFVRVLDAPQGALRSLALKTPAYLVRNLLGDTYNALGDERFWRLMRNQARSSKALADLSRHERALRAFKRELPEGKRTIKLSDEQAAQIGKALGLDPSQISRRMPAEAVALLAERMGVIRQGRMIEAMGEGRKLSRPEKYGPFRRTQQRIEDQTRLATFLGGLQRGMSPRDAAQRASDIHFDYSDLTSTEKTLFRRLALFYTFPSRNIPLQAKRLATRPGKTATLAKAIEEGRKQAGLGPDYQEGQDPYEARQLGIPIRWGTDPKTGKPRIVTISAGLPFTDLNDITDSASKFAHGDLLGAADVGYQRAVEMATPFIKLPAELKTNYSFFYRDAIKPEGEPLTRAPAWAIALAKKSPAARRKLGLVNDYVAPDGTRPEWGWPRKIDYAFRQGQPGVVGAFVDLAGLGTKGPDARQRTALQRDLARSGIRATTYDANRNRINQLYDARDRINGELEILRRRAAPGSDERISAERPTPRFTQLNDALSRLETELDKRLEQDRPGGLVHGRRVRPAPRSTSGGYATSTGGFATGGNYATGSAGGYAIRR